MKKYWRIIVDVQEGELLDKCDHLYDGELYDSVFTEANGDKVIDYLKEWDLDEFTADDIVGKEPRWCDNGSDIVHHSDGYTLIYNPTIGGCYMLYREAAAREIEAYFEAFIKPGAKVWWNDPAGESSAMFYVDSVDDNGEPWNSDTIVWLKLHSDDEAPTNQVLMGELETFR